MPHSVVNLAPRRLALRKTVCILGLILFLSLSLYSQDQGNDLTRIIDGGTITFGFTSADLPPFYSTNDKGQLEGLDVDIANQIASLLGVRPVFDRTSPTYAGLFFKAANGEVDVVVSKFSRTLDRSVNILFSDPYVILRRGMFVNKQFLAQMGISGNPIPFLKNLEGIKIGVPGGTSHETFARANFPNAQIIAYADRDKMYPDVVSQEIAACLYDETAIARAMHQIPALPVYATAYVFNDQKDYLAIGIAPGHVQLLNWINTYLQDYSVSYSVADLVKKYPEYYTGSES